MKPLNRLFAQLILAVVAFSPTLTSARNVVFTDKYKSNTTVSGVAANVNSFDLGDLDADGVVNGYSDTLPTNGSRKLFYLQHHPIQRFLKVTVDGVDYPQRDSVTGQTNYCYHPKKGWISFGAAFSSAQLVKAYYKWSSDLDAAIAAGDASNKNPEFAFDNAGNFKFISKIILAALSINTDVAVADINNDDKLDYYSEYAQPLKTYFHPKTNISNNYVFATFEVGNYYDGPRLGISADVDGDGAPDLIDYNSLHREPFLTQTMALGLYAKRWMPPYGSGAMFSSVDAGDMDGDGDLDLAFGSPTKNEFYRQDITTASFMLAEQMNGIGRLFVSPLSPREYSVPGDRVGGDVFCSEGAAMDNEYVYATSRQFNSVRKFRIDDFMVMASKGNLGSGIDQFNQPAGIAVDDTYVYICDTGNNRIVKRLKSDLSYVAQVGVAGDGSGGTNQLSAPYGIAVDSVSIYIGLQHATKARLQRRNKTDLTFMSILSNGTGAGADQLSSTLRGIAVDDSAVYIVDSGNKRVMKRNKVDLTALASLSLAVTPLAASVFEGELYYSRAGTPPLCHMSPTLAGGTTCYGRYNPTVIDGADTFGDAKFVVISTNPLGKYFRNFTKVTIPSDSANDGGDTREIDFEDFDNDGILDILNVASAPYRSAITYLGPVDASKVPTTKSMLVLLGPSGCVGAATGDVDGDGLIDLAFINRSAPTLEYLHNTAGGGIQYPAAWSTSESLDPIISNYWTSKKIQFADMDGDGQPDLVSTIDAAPYNGIIVFRQNYRVVRVKSTVDLNGHDLTYQAIYKTNADGTVNSLFQGELR